MKNFKTLSEDDFIRLDEIADHLKITNNETLQMAKSHKIVHALLFNVETVMERQYLKRVETKLTVKEVELLGLSETNKHYYYCLQEDDYLRIYNGENISKNEIYEETDQDEIDPMVRDVIVHSPQSQSNPFLISLDTLYIKKLDVALIKSKLDKSATLEKEYQEITYRREQTLLKTIGALIEINYEKNGDLVVGERWNSSGIQRLIEKQLLKKGYSCDGIKDTVLRKLIKESLSAIEENKKTQRK